MTETVLTPASPALDAAVLLRMAQDLDDPGFASVFATRYRQMLIARVNRINHALCTEDVDTALDAALSLKVASRAVGTRELADLAHDIEGSVRRLDVVGARTAAAHLRSVAARADRALAAYLSA